MTSARYPRPRRSSRNTRALGALVLALAGILVAGCARQGRRSPISGAGLSPSAPVETEPDVIERPVLSASGPPLEIRPVPITRIENGPPASGSHSVALDDVEAIPGEPVAAADPPRPAGAPSLVDAKVGEINGRPIYAVEFFEKGPGARLAERAKEKGVTFQDWVADAAKWINEEIQRTMEDELLEAEARASLKPSERPGLQAFVAQLGERERRMHGGSRTALERKLQQEENVTYEQYLRGRESDELVKFHVSDKINSRVFVTFRDIRAYYERNYKEYNPDPKARFRHIRVLAEQSDKVRTIQDALDRAEPFEKVASMPENTANHEQGGLQEKTFTGDLKDASPFGTVKELNEAARALAARGVGEWTRTPVTYGPWVSWLFLESIEVTRRPLTDERVQLEITDKLTRRKRQEVGNNYLSRLAEGASLGDVPEIRTSLLQIAILRYWETRQAAR